MQIPLIAAWCQLIVLLVACGMVQSTFADEETAHQNAKRWLISMMESMSSLNYRGTVVYFRDKKVETMQIVHAVANGVEQERLIALNEPMREVIRNADKVTCYFPDTQTVVVENKPVKRSFLIHLPEDLDADDEHYTFSLGQREHVAQKLAQLALIKPKDDYRYQRMIWIDVASKLPLKAELVDAAGQVVEGMLFTSLVIEDAIPLQYLNATTKVDKFTWVTLEDEHPAEQNLRWLLTQVPGGFRQVLYGRRRMHATRQPVDHILLSDGFSSVSIYIDQRDHQELAETERTIGAINSYTRELEKYQITVMGEVPAKTVRMIGEGIQIKDSQ